MSSGYLYLGLVHLSWTASDGIRVVGLRFGLQGLGISIQG